MGLRFDRIPFDELFAGNEPVLMRGLTADWPMVQAARQGPAEVMDLLAGNYNKKPVIVYVGDPEMRGRFGYNESVTGFQLPGRASRLRGSAGSHPRGSRQRGPPVLLHELHRRGSELSGLGRAELVGLRSSGLRPLPARREDLDRHRVARRWRTTTCRATLPAAYSGAGGSRCSARSRSGICIRAHSPRRLAGRS